MLTIIHNVNRGHGLVGRQFGGGLSFHKGLRYQKGAGFGSLLMKAAGWVAPQLKRVIPWIKGLFSYAKPLVTSVAKAGKEIITSKPVKDIIQETAVKATVDLLSGKDPKDTIKQVKKTLKKVRTKVIKSKDLQKTLKNVVNVSAHNLINNKSQESTKHIADVKSEILKALSSKSKKKKKKKKTVLSGKRKRGGGGGSKKKKKKKNFQVDFLD